MAHWRNKYAYDNTKNKKFEHNFYVTIEEMRSNDLKEPNKKKKL